MVALALGAMAAGSWLLGEWAAEPPAGEVVSGTFPVNAGAGDPRDISSHNSPELVRNPTNGANLIAVNRIDTPIFSCAMHTSFDGGAGWQTMSPLPIPAGEESPKCYAPDAAFGPEGTLHLAYVTLAGTGNRPNAIWMATSRDGGRTLSDPVRAFGDLKFQVRLMADPTTPDRLYLTWLDVERTATLSFPETGNPIMTAVSEDGGATWSKPVRISPEARQRVVAPSPVVGPDGALYVAYLDLGEDRLDYQGAHEGRGGPPYEGPWWLVLARSTDGGQSWAETTVDQITPTERFIVFLPPMPSVAVGEDGRVHVAFHGGRLGDPDVYAWTSRDGGASFGQAVRVNDTPRGDDTTQEMPRLAVAPDGRLDAVYYDRRADPEDVMTGVSLSSSVDGGRTFGDSLALSDRTFDSRIGWGSERDMADLGSRLGLISTDRNAFAVWADTRAGTEASGKQDLVRALVALAPRPDLPVWAPRAGRYGAYGLAGLAGLFLLLFLVGRRRPEPAPSGATADPGGPAPEGAGQVPGEGQEGREVTADSEDHQKSEGVAGRDVRKSGQDEGVGPRE